MIRLFEGADHARMYAVFRPTPPSSLIASMLDYVRAGGLPLHRALDVGCGSGQNTGCLAQHFGAVTGSDVSAAQIAEARLCAPPNVSYVVAPAEQQDVVPAGSVQLVTAAVCAHYLDKPRFFAAADRALTPGGVVAFYCYYLPVVYRDGAPWIEMTDVFHRARNALRSYIPQHIFLEVEAKFTDDKYRPPYPDIVREQHHYLQQPLSLELILGTIRTWSPFQAMVRAEGPEAAQRVVDEAESTCRSLLATAAAAGTDTEHTDVIRLHYFLIMARKPL